ncbi:BBP7 family outer membrane beta-barrel protein [Botrimarina hoheduenensis]|nr:BBP7 family outer membrane beta-barrel protein [Botrimarina hoheduenensis]
MRLEWRRGSKGDASVVNPLRTWLIRSTLLSVGVFGFTAAQAVAQEGVPTPAYELPDNASAFVRSGVGNESLPAGTVIEESDTRYAPLSSYFMPDGPPIDPHTDCLALTESSGTWLRRGLWYADLDAVIMNRTWDRRNLAFGQEFDLVSQQTVVQFVVDFESAVQVQNAELNRSSPGSEGMPRLGLGRFLFRDAANRDHTAEMVVFGGGEWVDQQGIDAQLLPPDGLFTPAGAGTGLVDRTGLHVPSQIDGTEPTNIDESLGLPSFDGADSMDIEYRSRFNSWELNYSVAQRMRKDRMELDPNGSWVRRASPGLTWDYLAGFRYFDLEEDLDWSATNIRSLDPTGRATDGAYAVGVSNNLFGGQLGLGITYEADRWNLTTFTKHGLYLNDGRAKTNVSYTDLAEGVDDPGFTRDMHQNGIAYMLQGGLTGRYHLRPNLSLRAGWEFMFLTNVALAPDQLDFNPAMGRLNLSGDIFYQGFTCGTEYYW